MQRDTQQGLTRREALKRGAVIAGGLAWATPLVQAVGMSPAYAVDTSDVPRVDCCIDEDTKLAVLRMKYLGEDNFCPLPTDPQPDALISCEDYSVFRLPNPAYIVSSKQKASITDGAIDLPDTIWFEGEVTVGQEFDIDSTLEIGETRFKGDAWIQIFDEGGDVPVLVQEIKIHTSCSESLYTNDRFGGVLLIGCTREDELEPASLTEEQAEPDTEAPEAEPAGEAPAETETGLETDPAGQSPAGTDTGPETETTGEAPPADG